MSISPAPANAAMAANPAMGAHGPKGVGVEQQAAQRLTLEHRRHRGPQGGVVGLGLGLGGQLGYVLPPPAASRWLAMKWSA